MGFTGRHYNKEEVPRVKYLEVNWSFWVDKLREEEHSFNIWNVVWDVALHNPVSWLSLLMCTGACASARSWQWIWQKVSQRWTREWRVGHPGGKIPFQLRHCHLVHCLTTAEVCASQRSLEKPLPRKHNVITCPVVWAVLECLTLLVAQDSLLACTGSPSAHSSTKSWLWSMLRLSWATFARRFFICRAIRAYDSLGKQIGESSKVGWLRPKTVCSF